MNYKQKFPRVRRIEYRLRHNYATVDVSFVYGVTRWSGNFYSHSPRTKAMLQGIEIIKQEIDYFKNHQIVFNKIGKYRWKQQ